MLFFSIHPELEWLGTLGSSLLLYFTKGGTQSPEHAKNRVQMSDKYLSPRFNSSQLNKNHIPALIKRLTHLPVPLPQREPVGFHSIAFEADAVGRRISGTASVLGGVDSRVLSKVPYTTRVPIGKETPNH